MLEFKNNPFPNTYVVEPKVAPSLGTSQNNQPRPAELPVNKNITEVYSYGRGHYAAPPALPSNESSKGIGNFWLVVLVLGAISFIVFYLFEKYWRVYKGRILLFLGTQPDVTESED